MEKKNNLDNNIAFALSNNSYVNNKISFKQLKYFNKYILKNRKVNNIYL